MSAGATPDWGGRDRAKAWVQVVVQAAVVVGLLVMLNLLARKFPARLDLTSQRRYALSPFAEDLVRGLGTDVEIWVTDAAYETGGDKGLPAAMRRTLDVLEEFRKRSPRIRVYPFAGPATERGDVFRKAWPESQLAPACLYLLADLGGGRTSQRVIEVPKIYGSNPATGELTAFRGEPVLVQTVKDLLAETKRVVYESEGHQEVTTASPQHVGVLANFLRLNEGYEFRPLRASDYKQVPLDCSILAVLAPAQPFTDEEIALFRDYLERGGSLLAVLRPKVRTGFEKLLEEYGVKAGENLVLDPVQFNSPRMSDLVVTEFNAHDVNRGMANVTYRLPETCTIDPIDKRDTRIRITPLVMSGPKAWEEKGELTAGMRPKPDADERTGNLKLLVAVEKDVERPVDERHKTAKISVWGSPAPFSNAILNPGGFLQQVQLQYVVNHFRWLADRELMEVRQDVAVRPLEMSEEARSTLWGVVVCGFPGFALALGGVVWFTRRK